MTVSVSAELVNFIRPSEHSRFSPSGTDKWVACPYSIKASEKIPEETSSYAAEGTLAHQICEDLYHHRYDGADKSNDLMMASDEMLEAAEMYIDCIRGWRENSDEIGEILWFGLEKGIPIFPEHSCYGTADCVIVGTKGCAVIDFKYGKGRNVGARTSQLFNYILGVYRHLIGMPEDYKFHAVVVQPRTDYLPKCHEYTKQEFPEFEQKIYNAILEADKEGLVPFEGNHCFWCKAKRTKDPQLKCPAIANKAIKVANENFDKFLTDMNTKEVKTGALNTVRDKALIKIMSLYPMMKQIVKDAEEEFSMRIEKGENIEGLRYVEKLGNRKWRLSDKDEMAAEIRKVYPQVNPLTIVPATTKLMTQGALKKQVGANKFNEALVIRPIKKTLEVMDGKQREVLGDLASYGKMIGLNLER